MSMNLKVVRIKSKLEEMYNNKIDITDVESNNKFPDQFYTRAIAAQAIIMRCGISEDVAGKCITDGYHDMGIDAVYNDITQKKLFFVQSKWRKEGSGSISQDEMSTFVEGIKRVINCEFEGCNSKLYAKKTDIEEAIRNMNYQIEMIFCHTGNQKISDYVFRPVKELLKHVNGDDSDELLVFSEIQLQNIYEYLANGQNQNNIILDDVVLNNWGKTDVPIKAYYGTISACVIGEWYKKYGNQLFDKNIRYYKGSTEVNQGIKNVLKTEPEKFFYYNNGIKILCRKITRKILYSNDRATGLFKLEGVSLVNGAQTTGTIGGVFCENPEAVSNAKVLIQMIDLGACGENQEDQAIQITKLSNTQNRIEGKDFASLDPEQERLRMELSLGGIQYLYKDGSQIEDPQHQILLDETIVSQACLLEEISIVALVKGNIGALTENIDKAPYKKLFNGSTNSFTMYNGVLVLRAIESYIKENESNVTGRKKLVLIHGNRFLLHLVLKEIKNIDNFNDTYLDQEEIKSKVSSICEKYWNKVYEIIEKDFPDAYPAYLFKNVGRLKEIIKKI